MVIKMKVILATNNLHKVEEIKALVKNTNIEIISLKDFNDEDIVEETGKSFNENALLKAEFYDSGIGVPSLNNQPGVFSARYSGENATDEENNQKLLQSMKNIADRQAYFHCSVCYFDGEANYFEGKLYGTIANNLVGNNGFGYDPLFILNDSKRLAQKTMDEKNKISHRAKAFSKWLEFMIRRG